MNNKKLNNNPVIRINPALIPEAETKLLAMALLDAVRKFYSDPKNEEKFQEWQKQRQQRQQKSNDVLFFI